MTAAATMLEKARSALAAWGCAANPVAAAAASAAMAEALSVVVNAIDDPDAFRDPRWLEFARRAREELQPKLEGSSVAVTLFDGEIDPKVAIETGYMVLMDKPIIAMVVPGVRASKKLIGVADEVVEGSLDDPSTMDRIKAAMDRIDALEKSQENGDPAP